MKPKHKLLAMSGIIASAIVVCLAVSFAELFPGGEAVVINEIMYNPPWNSQAQMTDEQYEWIELYNPTVAAVDLSGYRLTTNQQYEFIIPAGTKLEAGGYLIVAADIRAFTGGLPFGWAVDCPVLGNSGNDTRILSNAGDTVRLLDPKGRIVDEVSYTDRLPWPVEASGTGSTLELKSPLLDNTLPSSWSASSEREFLGTPGRPNSVIAISATWQAATSAAPAEAIALARIDELAITIQNNDARELVGLAMTVPAAWSWSGRSGEVSVSIPGTTVMVQGLGRRGNPYRIVIGNLAVATGTGVTITIRGLRAGALAGEGDVFWLEGTDGERWSPTPKGLVIPVIGRFSRADHLVINEVYNNGGDTVQANYYDWIELYNPTDTPVCLDGWMVMDAEPRRVLDPRHPHEGALVIPDPTPVNDHVIEPGGYFLLVVDEQYYRLEFPQGPAPQVEGNLDFRSRNTAGQRVDDPSKDGPAPDCRMIGSFGLNKTRDEVVLYDGRDIVDAVGWGNGNSFNMLTSEILRCGRGESLARRENGQEAQEPHGELTELVGNSFRVTGVPTPGGSNQ